jgi:PKHD-type hydroxylase
MAKQPKFRAGLELKQSDFLNDFVVLKNIFSPMECDKIINLRGNKGQSYVASDTGPVLNYFSRRSKSNFIAFNKHMTWVLDRLAMVFTEVNNNLFKFNLAYMNDVNILEYKQEGFFAMHTDVGASELSYRKLSLVCFLSDPEDYVGGKLTFYLKNSDFEQERGSVVIFPSYLFHQVQPLTSGVRYTLIAWACGPVFR